MKFNINIMQQDFNTIIPRKGTNSVKYDLLKQLFGREDLLSLWVADMDFACPDFILDAIKKRAEHPVFGYSIRSEAYLDAIVQWQKNRHQWDIQAQDISFSPGVVTGLYLAMEAFTQKGDKIIVQPPVYFPFFHTVKNNGRILIENQLKEKDDYYTMDLEQLRSEIDENTKMLFLCNPHNPVGRAWKREELEELVDLCYEKNILIVSDEIHSDLVFAPNQHIPIASISEKAKEITFTLMAPSKTFNVAGLSTSYMICQNKKLRTKYEQRLEAAHLSQGNIFGTVALQAAYEHGGQWVDELMQYLQNNAHFVVDYIQENIPEIGIKMPEATYLMWLNMSNLNLKGKKMDAFFVEKAGLAINNGKMFGKGGLDYARINIGMPKQQIEQALTQLEKAVKTFSF